MTKYIVELFETRNTSFSINTDSIEMAHKIAKYHDKYIIHDSEGRWEEFEKKEGEIPVSWSYPNGLGQIKINS